MADNPPVDLGVGASSSDGAPDSALAELWRNLWPWDDLNAKLPPERWLTLGRDILPALAALTAQGPDRPRLLITDAVSRLQVATGLNAIQRLTSSLAAGDNVLPVDSTVPFAVGAYVLLAQAPGNAPVTTTGPYRILNIGTAAMSIVGQVPVPYSTGDFVVALPMFTAIGDGFIDRPVDQALQQIGGAGAATSLTFPAIPNMCWTLAYLDASLRQTGAVAVVTTVQVWDGPASTGTLLYSGQLAAVPTAGAGDHLPGQKRSLRSTRGNALTITGTGPGATGTTVLAAGAWQTVDRGTSE